MKFPWPMNDLGGSENMREKRFGSFIIDVDADHAIIRREDNETADPTFYELQHMKDIAFGRNSAAIEVFPNSKNLVDGANQRHLWKIDYDKLQKMKTEVPEEENKDSNLRTCQDYEYRKPCKYGIRRSCGVSCDAIPEE